MQRSSSPGAESSQSSPPAPLSAVHSPPSSQVLAQNRRTSKYARFVLHYLFIQQTYPTHLAHTGHNGDAVVLLGLAALTPVPILHTSPTANVLDFEPAFLLQGCPKS